MPPACFRRRTVLTRRDKLKVELSSEERVEACLQTLALCTRITRDLIGDAEKINGAIALAALAQVFDQMIADVVLASTPEEETS